MGGPGGWWILDEPELHLNADILVPDLASWRRDKMPRLPDTAWFELAPDWVCEILSPSTARIDRVEKLPIYVRHGVQHAWLVDPDLRTLEVFENCQGEWLLLTVLENNADVCGPPFDAITFAPGDSGRIDPSQQVPPPTRRWFRNTACVPRRTASRSAGNNLTI